MGVNNYQFFSDRMAELHPSDEIGGGYPDTIYNEFVCTLGYSIAYEMDR